MTGATESEPPDDKRPAANNQPMPEGNHYRIAKGEQLWDRLVRIYGLEKARYFFIGNILKYVERYQDKDGIRDLEKARHYIDKLIELEKASDNQEAPRTEQQVKQEWLARVTQRYMGVKTGDIRVNMNQRAEECGLGHWKCLDPAGIRVWQRSDGLLRRITENDAGTTDWRKYLRDEDTRSPIDPTGVYGYTNLTGRVLGLEEAVNLLIVDKQIAENKTIGPQPPYLAQKPTTPEATEYCCECGNEYPMSDLHALGKIYCEKCRHEWVIPGDGKNEREAVCSVCHKQRYAYPNKDEDGWPCFFKIDKNWQVGQEDKIEETHRLPSPKCRECGAEYAAAELKDHGLLYCLKCRHDWGIPGDSKNVADTICGKCGEKKYGDTALSDPDAEPCKEKA